MKNLVILGSTGSIGVNALKVVSEFPEHFNIVGLTAGNNGDKLFTQIQRFRPLTVALLDEKEALKLARRCREDRALKDLKVEVLAGLEGLNQVASVGQADIVLSAIVGAAGLAPTLSAIRAKKTVALANKEPFVMAGELIREEAEKNGVRILPVDSEHSAVFQAMEGHRWEDVKRIILTASGGPLLDVPLARRKTITPARALKHPTWKMGAKISIDSATLVNKGLEVIEARWLFEIPPDRIDVVIHRQSVIHSMVEFRDGSILAQMGIPDMRGPLAYAMSYPNRLPLSLPPLDLEKIGKLTFERPDRKRFPCLGYAYDAIQEGGTMPAVLNAANEVAVRAFLDKKIGFLEIGRLIRKTMNAHEARPLRSLEDVMESDGWARVKVEEMVGRAAGKSRSRKRLKK